MPEAPEEAPEEASTPPDELAALAGPLRVLGNEKRLDLLSFLTTPHYIREIASELGVARQTAQEHVDKLVDIGVVERRRGRRESGPVTEYVVVPQRLFALQETFAHLGRLEPDIDDRELRAVTQPLEDEAGPGAADPVPRLLVVHGLQQGRAVPLDGSGPWLIGRDPSAQICLDTDPYVSTRHAELRRSGDGFELLDLYSRNGTHVDWEPLDRGGRRELVPGAVLGIGRTLTVFRLPD